MRRSKRCFRRFSPRERFLIGALVVCVLWAAAWTGVVAPCRRACEKTKERQERLAEEQSADRLYLSHYGELERQLAFCEQESGRESLFYREIDSADMDRSLQKLAGETGVRIRRMTIGEGKRMEPGSRGEADGEPSAGGTREGEEAEQGSENRPAGAVNGEPAQGAGEPAGPADWKGTPGTNAGERTVKETMITLELESPDAEGIMCFVDALYREPKSVLVTGLDVTAEYGTDGSGREVYEGMKGTMEVRYYHEQSGV